MRIFISLFAFILIFSLNTALYSQQKTSGTSKAEIISSPKENQVINEIVRNLNIARSSNSKSNVEYWEKKLSEETNLKTEEVKPDLNFIGKKETPNTFEETDALNVTKIQNEFSLGVAVSYNRFNGDIFVGTVISGFTSPDDTIRIFRSTNNGLSFFPIYSVPIPDARNNTLDIEVISKGDSSYIFAAFDFIYGGNNCSYLFRIREDGNRFVGYPKNSGNGTIQYKGAKITSDNANFTDFTYIYFSYEMDSLVSGQIRVNSKLEVMKSVYNFFFTISDCYQGSSGQYGYNIGGAAPAGYIFETDIAYVNTTSNINQLYTVTVVRGVPGAFSDGTGLYFTRSSDYGVTQPTLFAVTNDIKLKKSPRIASSGYRDNSLTVVTNRLFSNGDWDPYNFLTNDITVSAPTFNNAFVTTSTDTTFTVSVAARYRSNNSYIFGYSDYKTLGPTRYANVFINTLKNGVYNTPTQVNNVLSDSYYGFPGVSFRNVNNDSCFAIWSGTDVTGGTYVTGGCSGPFIGINNHNTITNGYSLEQNFPNPFNPSTSISFFLQKNGFVNLKVYDILGNEIETLLSENKPAGSYTVSFDGSKLANGIYFYKINIGDFTDTKRMVLVK